jgi:serine/threonine-protein phosphatase PP1 catalytic subunit
MSSARDFDLFCRAHQAVMSGYQFPFNSGRGVVTIFSAPNYCCEYWNKGSALHVSESLLCSFTIIKPVDWKAPPHGSKFVQRLIFA